MFGFLKQVGDYTKDAVSASQNIARGLSVTLITCGADRSRSSTPTRS